MKPSTQFHRFALPTHHHFIFDQPSAPVRLGGLLMQIEHARLHFVIFHTRSFCPLSAPANASFSDLPAVHHEHSQPTGFSLRLSLLRRTFKTLFGLLLSQASDPLHQLVQH